MPSFKQTYLDGLKNILENIEIDGIKLINAVEDDYDEYAYMNAMRELYNNIFSIIEIEFDMVID